MEIIVVDGANQGGKCGGECGSKVGKDVRVAVRAVKSIQVQTKMVYKNVTIHLKDECLRGFDPQFHIGQLFLPLATKQKLKDAEVNYLISLGVQLEEEPL